jgi:uncharacterized protein
MRNIIHLGLFFTALFSLTVVTRAQNQGNYEQAAEQCAKKAGKTADSKDGVLLKLEEGAAWRCAGKYELSNQAFDLAEDRVNFYDDQAKIKVSDTAKNTILGPSSLPYEGYAYDKILMNTYKALNYIQLGQYDKARVELNRALERQREAVELNAARLEKAREKSQKQEHQADTDKVQSDEQFQSGVKKEYSDLDEMKFYADYVNPLTVYLDGLFFMTQASGGSDYERSHKSFDRVRAMSGDNPFIQADVDAVIHAQAGQFPGPVTYVIFEAGKSPAREETHLNTPTYMVGAQGAGGVQNASVAFPKLRFQNQSVAPLSINANGTNVTAVLLASMDNVEAHEFKDTWSLVLTQTLTAYCARGVAGGAAKKGGFGGLGGAMAGLAIDVWLKSVNHADVRAWNSLPKEYYFCRIPTPADRKIELATLNGREKTSVTVDEGKVNLVWVKAADEPAALLISQGKLK